jgi:thiol:disulfide interchange protein
MKKILSLLAILLLAKATIAQDKSPVQFVFSTQRTSDSLVQLTISAKLEKGFQLFGLKKQSNEDEFVSSLQLDNTITTDSIIEEGKLMQIPATDASLPAFRVYEDSVRFSYFFKVPANDSIILKGSLNWLGKQADEYPSGSESFAVEVLPTSNDEAENNSEIANQTLWQIFLLTFLTGLLAVITPCVFPLIPVTVSFFLKRSKTRAAGIKNALWYSLSIIGIYTVPTILLVLLFGDDILYQISTSAISNLLFFAIFLVFAISFFGAFELQLPNSWANKADQKAGKGGLGGIFFMALTLVIVSFSCTGPIVGTLLGQTSTGGVSTAPIIGMLGFGVGLALPFSLFAFFPSMLQSLPKSGGWLNSVKVSFGFIELALALKFLSNVDLIYHWRLLDRDVFLVLWIVIFVLLGFIYWVN